MDARRGVRVDGARVPAGAGRRSLAAANDPLTGPAAPAAGSRTRVFIGDVQGCARELDLLLGAIAFDRERHELWFAGDLVNRGPDSLGALRRAREIGARTVLGNHDLHLLGLADGTRRMRPDDTLQPVLDAPDRDALLGWLREQPLVHTWSDLVLVHAGLHPRWDDPDAIARPLEAQIRAGRIPWDDATLLFLTRVRHCDAQGRRPPSERPAPAGFEPWDHFYQGTRRVVCGHWAQRGLVKTERLRAIDTGCIWGGELTAWLAEPDRTVSVPAARRYQNPG